MPEETANSRSGSGQARMAVILILLVLGPLGYSVVYRAVPGNTEPVEAFLERPDPKYENCVRETDYMRNHHWELLRGVREEVVRYGIRGEVSLSRCQECHTSRERFCNKCHDAVSLTPDCFDCHYYP